jgi:hypothetical protein
MADPTLPGQDVATIVATSLENIKPKLIDNLSTEDAFFYWINQKQRVDYEDGGYVIREPLLYAGNNTIKSYYPGEYLETERPTGFTSLKYGWSFVGGTFTIDGPTEFMNSGKHGIINLVQGYIEQLRISFSQTMTDMFFGDGTGNNGADMHGLALLIENDSAWSTVGDIDSNANTWWRNQFTDISGTNWGSGADNATILAMAIKHVIKLCSKPGYGKPDGLMTCLDQYELYERALMSKIIYHMPGMADAKIAEAGFGGMRLDGIPVMFDQNLDGHATEDNTWFVKNSKCLRLVIGKNKAFQISQPIEHPLKDAKLFKAKLYGQLTVRGRRDALGRVLASATYA